MTYDELAGGKAIVEIDDVLHANVVIDQICNMKKEHRMFKIAELLATLREYYVEIGRDLENDKLRGA